MDKAVVRQKIPLPYATPPSPPPPSKIEIGEEERDI